MKYNINNSILTGEDISKVTKVADDKLVDILSALVDSSTNKFFDEYSLSNFNNEFSKTNESFQEVEEHLRLIENMPYEELKEFAKEYGIEDERYETLYVKVKEALENKKNSIQDEIDSHLDTYMNTHVKDYKNTFEYFTTSNIKPLEKIIITEHNVNLLNTYRVLRDNFKSLNDKLKVLHKYVDVLSPSIYAIEDDLDEIESLKKNIEENQNKFALSSDYNEMVSLKEEINKDKAKINELNESVNNHKREAIKAVDENDIRLNFINLKVELFENLINIKDNIKDAYNAGVLSISEKDVEECMDAFTEFFKNPIITEFDFRNYLTENNIVLEDEKSYDFARPMAKNEPVLETTSQDLKNDKDLENNVIKNDITLEKVPLYKYNPPVAVHKIYKSQLDGLEESIQERLDSIHGDQKSEDVADNSVKENITSNDEIQTVILPQPNSIGPKTQETTVVVNKPKITCSNCGENNDISLGFCANCGAKLETLGKQDIKDSSDQQQKSSDTKTDATEVPVFVRPESNDTLNKEPIESDKDKGSSESVLTEQQEITQPEDLSLNIEEQTNDKPTEDNPPIIGEKNGEELDIKLNPSDVSFEYSVDSDDKGNIENKEEPVIAQSQDDDQYKGKFVNPEAAKANLPQTGEFPSHVGEKPVEPKNFKEAVIGLCNAIGDKFVFKVNSKKENTIDKITEQKDKAKNSVIAGKDKVFSVLKDVYKNDRDKYNAVKHFFTKENVMNQIQNATNNIKQQIISGSDNDRGGRR